MRFLELAGLVSGARAHLSALATGGCSCRAVAILDPRLGQTGSYMLAVGTANRVQAVRWCALALCRDIIFIFGVCLCVLGSRDRAQVARQAGMASTQQR